MITLDKKQLNFDGICFLDVDGVLNSECWFENIKYKQLEKELNHLKDNGNDTEYSEYLARTHFDPASLNKLNIILKQLNLAIVICSTWRGSYLTRHALEISGIDNYKNRFLGCTPNLSATPAAMRGHEVKYWLNSKNYTGGFIIIDDQQDFAVEYNGINLMSKLVNTTWYGENGGLQDFHIKISTELFKT